MPEPSELQYVVDGNNPTPIVNSNKDVIEALLPTSAQKAALLPANPLQEVSANATVATTTRILLADTTGGDITVTLPPAASFPVAQPLLIMNRDGDNTLRYQADGTDTIDGVAYWDLINPYGGNTIMSTGTEWLRCATPGG